MSFVKVGVDDEHFIYKSRVGRLCPTSSKIGSKKVRKNG